MLRTLMLAGVAMGALAVASGSAAQQANGQGPATNSASGNNAMVGEVVVTAQKRTERLQDVPLSVSAVTERDILKQGITRFTDVVSREPGLHLSEDSTQSSFTVRGISSSASADTTSATAGIYVDDYPLYDTWFRFASPNVNLFDIERVEVLRGPQGTLYGATSLSGSIRILTNKPNLDHVQATFEGTGSATDGGNGNYAASGMVNIPIIAGKLGVRAVAYDQSQGGWIDNPVRGQSNVNGQRDYGARFYIEARPAEDWNILATVTYQHDENDDQNASYYFPPAGRDSTDFNSVLPTQVRSDFGTASLSIDKKFGAANLNVTGTLGFDQSNNVGDGTPIATAFGVPVATPFYQPSRSRTKILEVRYTSDASKRFRYVLGAYANTRYRSFEQDADQAALAPYFGTGRIYDVYANQRATELAAFGEGTWEFLPKLEATVGLRVFRNSYHFYSDVSGLLNSFAAPLTPNLTNVSNNNISATPRFSLAYKPNRDLNFYATVSEGYRFGLTNYNSGADTGVPLTYKPDTLWNYEAGMKMTFLGGMGSLNTSIYYEDWRDIQISFRNANGQAYITNAGNARSYGVESELLLHPNPAWEFNAALSLGKAELTTDNPGIQARAASIRGPAVYGVFAGEELPGSQKVSASGGVQYNLIDLFDRGNAYIRLDDVYVGSSYVDFLHNGSLKIGDYNLINLRLGYKMDRYEVVLFSDNLFNSHGIVNAVPDGDITGLTDWAYRVHPRTIGVTVRANY